MSESIKLDSLTKEIISRKPMHRKFMHDSMECLTNDENQEIEWYLSYLANKGLTMDKLSKHYLVVVEDTFREELYFKKFGRYRHQTYDEVAAHVYQNPEYMESYMIGLALSSFFWLNHVKIRRFFDKHLPKNTEGLYREVGPGHGLFFLKAMKQSSYTRYEGLDISPTSVALTKSIVKEMLIEMPAKHVVVEKDFLKLSDDAELSSALVMGEVLEHVEEPKEFLKKAYQTTTHDAWFFLTTCFNAPAVDHIYNPENLSRLNSIIEETGWIVSESLLLPKPGCSLELCKEERLPVNIALVLEKA